MSQHRERTLSSWGAGLRGVIEEEAIERHGGGVGPQHIKMGRKGCPDRENIFISSLEI